MKTTKYIFTFLFVNATFLSAQNMRMNSQNSLFSDYKANRVGDAVTIIVVESSQATNSSETSTGRKSEIGFEGAADYSMNGSQGQGGDASLGIGSRNEFKGSGTTKAGGQVRTKISATIDSVLTNGNMFVQGSRKIVINGEEQIMKIKGVVRPSDILADNSVLSYNISEAEIIIEGDGMIASNQKPGWLTRFFRWLF